MWQVDKGGIRGQVEKRKGGGGSYLEVGDKWRHKDYKNWNVISRKSNNGTYLMERCRADGGGRPVGEV